MTDFSRDALEGRGGGGGDSGKVGLWNIGVRWALGVLLVAAVVDQLLGAPGWGRESWQLGDWLIHYGEGFVRRGLAGSGFRMLAEWSGIPANHWVIAFSLAVYLVLAGGVLGLGRRAFSPALLLSCVVLGFPAYQNAIIRKDCLELLLLAACVSCIDREGPPMLRWAAVNVMACAALLIHETFAFFALPALVLIGRGGSFCWRSMARRAAWMLPAYVCFSLTVIFHGSAETARAIHESWIPLWVEIEGPGADLGEPAGAIAALGWSAEEGMSLTKGIWGSGPYQPTAWAMVFGVSLVLVLAFMKPGPGGAARRRMLGLLIFQFVCISPLFVLGIDYGRWLFLWVLSSMILLISGREAALPGMAGVVGMVEHPIVRAGLDRLSRHEWVLLFFGVPVLWSMRNFLTAGPVPGQVWSWFGPFWIG